MTSIERNQMEQLVSDLRDLVELEYNPESKDGAKLHRLLDLIPRYWGMENVVEETRARIYEAMTVSDNTQYVRGLSIAMDALPAAQPAASKRGKEAQS